MKNNQNKIMQDLLEFSIVNIDKPSGPTSFKVSEFVKKRLRLRKTSHFGTLDPKVTGVLPVALNRACKLTGFFLGHDKEYMGVMRTHKKISIKKLQEIINKNFIGKIIQLPPKKSKVKRQKREREIKKFELIEQSEDKKDFLFLAEVQGGTYIRKLCSDLGQHKEINGAHMLEFRRVRAGIFSENSKEFPIINLYDFKEAISDFEKGKEENLKKILIPAEKAIKKIMPFSQLSKKADLKHILTGKPLFKKDFEKDFETFSFEKIFAVFFGEKCIGIYEKINETDKNEQKKMIAKPLFVLQPIDNKNKKQSF